MTPERSPSATPRSATPWEAEMSTRTIRSGAPRPLAHDSEAVVAGDLVLAAGQLASDFKTGVPA